MYKAADYRCLKPEKDKVNIYIPESYFKQIYCNMEYQNSFF
jgi:hypothetical protein